MVCPTGLWYVTGVAMTWRSFVLGCVALSLVSGQALKERSVATGWTVPESGDYEAGIDRKVVHSGHGSLFLKSAGANAKDYSARQRIRAGAYRGKRVRLSGWVKPDQAVEGGALWLRVDFKNGDYVLDGMLELGAKDRSIPMTNGWAKCVLVADVPEDAIGLSFGLRMRGAGEFWGDDLALEVVSKSTPTSTIERRPYRTKDKDAAIQRMVDEYAKAPERPVNLGFETP
jgi:hypothetical protein